MNALSLIFYKSVGTVTDSSHSKVSLELSNFNHY